LTHRVGSPCWRTRPRLAVRGVRVRVRAPLGERRAGFSPWLLSGPSRGGVLYGRGRALNIPFRRFSARAVTAADGSLSLALTAYHLLHLAIVPYWRDLHFFFAHRGVPPGRRPRRRGAALPQSERQRRPFAHFFRSAPLCSLCSLCSHARATLLPRSADARPAPQACTPGGRRTTACCR
jgi:hypothetical protein